MKTLNVGVPVDTYYRGAQGGTTSTYDNRMPVTASANGSLSQSASGSVSLAGHPGMWLIVLTAGMFVFLHRSAIMRTVEG